MGNELSIIRARLLQKPYCKTFMCLVRREKLAEELFPQWLTRLVNWTISG